MEIGVLFWRHQFTRAMSASNIEDGRRILDSLQTETPDRYDVEMQVEQEPKGVWHLPRTRHGKATLLYFHGGGYAFHGAMSRRFAAMLAHRTGAPLFAPDYRLTPEHPHPAQAEDALSAWRHMIASHDPRHLVVIGDSAGGHMMLMLLAALRDAGLPQPALGVGLCPWTDIGERGASLHDNDRYDLVQGWMALQFGQWLDPEGRFGQEALSPISRNYAKLAPLYLQSGEHDILRDMTRDFAKTQADSGADVLMDLWPAMPHDFQLLDGTQDAARAALQRLSGAIRWAVDNDGAIGAGPVTTIAAGVFARPVAGAATSGPARCPR